MNIDHARYFIALAKTPHIQKTARLLGISPTAISHGITRLEEELGLKLTTKVGRNIILTDKGIEFARKVGKVIQQLDEIKEDLSTDRILPGNYTLGITHGLFDLCFDQGAIQELGEGEEVSFEVLSLRSAEVIRAVVEGKVDLGICYSPLFHPGAQQRVLKKGQLVFVAKPTHLVFKDRTREARIQRLQSCAAIGTKSFQGIDNCESHPVFGRLKLKPQYKYVVDSYESMLPILRESEAWAFIPDLMAKRYGKALKVIDLGEMNAPYTVEAVWNKERKPLLLFQNLLNLIGKEKSK